MKPETSALNVLSTTRARAKMREFRVAEQDFNQLPRDPAILFGLAVGILGDVASVLAGQIDGDLDAFLRPESWNDEDLDPVAALRFASAFFDSYINSELDVEITPELSLLCAVAYYISGNVGSAAVIVRQMEPPDDDIAGGLGLLLYSILKNEFNPIEIPHVHQERTARLLKSIKRFFELNETSAQVANAAIKFREYFFEHGSPREILFSDALVAVCALKLHNAARVALPVASDLSLELWSSALTKPGFPIELWPAQQRIAGAGVIGGKSAVIQMPTSAGKTRATELIIRSAFLSQRARMAVIVAPYRSLCHDIRGDLVKAFLGEDIYLDEASDSYQFDLTLDALLGGHSVLIVTPEKLLYMLRRAPELAERIGLLIYDEGHQFDGMARGPTYELLLTSLRMALPSETQVILISAVIGNAGDISEWLIGDRDSVVGGAGLLPTTKSIAFSSWQDQRGRLEYVDPEDPGDREFFVPRVIGRTTLELKGRETAERSFPEHSGSDVGLFLGLHVVNGGSVAIFCGRKDSVLTICKRVVDLDIRNYQTVWPSEYSNSKEVEAIRLLSERELGANAPVTHAARLGIFAHSADTPRGLRLSIEHAMKLNLAKFVVCTSTLAQGVNFPLRYLIVTTTQQGGERILVRDFHNLMGRAGRAGMHTEGSVIFSAPKIYDQRLQFGRGQRNWQEATRLLDAANSEPSRSSILYLFDPYTERRTEIELEVNPEWLDLAFADASRIEEVVDAALEIEPNISRPDFRKFIEDRARVIQDIAAFLVSNMTFAADEVKDERIAELAANTLAYHLADEDTKPRLIEVFRSIGASVAANTNDDQRIIIKRSPLPPRAVAELRTWLNEDLPTLRTATIENRLLEEISMVALRFSSSRKIKAITNQDVIPRTLREWVSGNSYAQILASLQEVDARVSGRRRRPRVEDAVALCEDGFGYDVAMIVASIADLAEDLDQDLHLAATLLQRQIKCGLTEHSSLAFYEAGFSDRYVAKFLGNSWPGVVNRTDVRATCEQEAAIRQTLAQFPIYFTSVAAEIGGWTV